MEECTRVIKMVKLKCPLPAVLLAFISGLSAFCEAGTAFIEKGTFVACQKENLQKRPGQNQKINLYTRMELVNIFSMANKFI